MIVHTFVGWFVRSCVLMFVWSFVVRRSFDPSLVHSFVRSIVRSFVRSSSHSGVRSLVRSFVPYFFIKGYKQ